MFLWGKKKNISTFSAGKSALSGAMKTLIPGSIAQWVACLMADLGVASLNPSLIT